MAKEKLRVLIVDDDDLVRVHLAHLLSAAHYVVHQLPSAIGVTRAVLHHHIDVVVIDIMMPSLSGDKLAALLRQNTRFAGLAVILISSRPTSEIEALAATVGADAVINKANSNEQLVSAVERVASRRRREITR